MSRTRSLTVITTVALAGTLLTACGADATPSAAVSSPPAVAQAAASTSLPATEVAALRYMREEEKLARDVYTVLAETSGDQRFTRIASSEQQHMDRVKGLLDRYAITDPAAGMGPGEFRNADLQRLYTKLVARGRTSATAALAVGRTIERTDIADLDERLDDVTTTSVRRVFTNLRRASENHLRAFGG